MVKLGTLDKSHPGIYLADRVIQCTSCKFAHLYPLPDPATVDRYYEGDYFYAGDKPHSPPDWFEKERAEYEAGLWDSYFGYLAGLLDVTKPVIDFGAGAGWFLHYLSQHGWPQALLYGIEPSRTAWQASPIKHRLYKELPKGDRAIRGNVVLSLVLEHIPDPARFLQEDVLPHLDGRLVVVVPNEFNPIQRYIINSETKLGASFDWMRFELKHKISGAAYQPWFISSVHVNYFNGQSLRGLLERCGLKVVSESSTCPVELAIAFGYDYRGDDTRGRRIHLTRLKLEKKFGTKMFFMYRLLYRLFGIGREIVMVATK